MTTQNEQALQDTKNGSATQVGKLVATPSQTLMPSPEIGKAIAAYRKLQGELDTALDGSMITIQGKKFRTKSYWRAVQTAFALQVSCIEEERVKGETDWGFLVTYRATAPNGAFADGDGACMASEKASDRTGKVLVHNVRAHAHTRAFNRAVSNLVGFGEVSAEEVQKP